MGKPVYIEGYVCVDTSYDHDFFCAEEGRDVQAVLVVKDALGYKGIFRFSLVFFFAFLNQVSAHIVAEFPVRDFDAGYMWEGDGFPYVIF